LTSIILIFTLIFSSFVVFNTVEVQAEEIEWTGGDLFIMEDTTINSDDDVIARGRIIIDESASLTVYGTLLCKRDPSFPEQTAGIDVSGELLIDGSGQAIGRVEIDTSIMTPGSAGISIQGGDVTLKHGKINWTDDDPDEFFTIVIEEGMDGTFTTVGTSVNSNSIVGVDGFVVAGGGYTLENLTIDGFNETGIEVDGMRFSEGSFSLKHVVLKDTGEQDQVGLSLLGFPSTLLVDYALEDVSIDSDIGILLDQAGTSPVVMEGFNVSEYVTGVDCRDGAEAIFVNSVISSDRPPTYDVVITQSSKVKLFDSMLYNNADYSLNMDEAEMYSGRVEFGTLINVSVTNQYGEPVPGADVSVKGTVKIGPNPEDTEQPQMFPFSPFNPSYFTNTTNETGILTGVPVVLNNTHTDDNQDEETRDNHPHRVNAGLHDAENFTEKDAPDQITPDTEWVNVTLWQYPDMYIDGDNISLSKARPPAGINEPPLYVNATVFNNGNYTTTCNVSFSYSTVNETNGTYTKFIGYDNITVAARSSAVAGVIWDTTQNMSGSGNRFMNGSHTIHVNITEAKGEWNTTLADNNASKDVMLYMPRPDLVAMDIQSLTPVIVDGDQPVVEFNLSNIGEAAVGDARVIVAYARENTTVTWDVNGSYLTNVTNITTIELGGHLYSQYDHWLNVSHLYYTMLNFTWNTTDLANDSLVPDLEENLWNYTIHLTVIYNNTINSSTLSGENLTYYLANMSFSIYKYYEVAAETDNNISFINPDKPETSFPITVMNSGRANDEITVSTEYWASNATNEHNWDYTLYLVNETGDWIVFTEGVDVFNLTGGNLSTLHANVSGTKQVNEIIGDPGEFYYVNLTFTSTGDGTKMAMVSLLVVNGRGDLFPVEVRFFRQDGVEAKRKAQDEHDERSLLMNETSYVRVFIQNLGNATVYLPFEVAVKDTTMNVWFDNVTHTGEIKRLGVSWVDVPYNFTDPTFENMVHNFAIYVDSPDVINESNENNNEATAKIFVKDENPTDDYTFKGNAFSWDGITKVEDASVNITNTKTGTSYTTTTDANGYFTIVVPKDEYTERDLFTITVEVKDVNSEHYPLKDLFETPPVYSEDNATSHDLILLADGVDLAIYKRYEHNISLYRKDGKRTNAPIVDDEIEIEFFIANRGRNSTKANYTIMVDGIVREEKEYQEFSTTKRLTRITFPYTFTEIALDHNISVMVASEDDLYVWNNFSLRENIQVKGKDTNADYIISASIYENDAITPASFADVVIKNIRTNQSISFQADKDGKFENKNLRTITEGYKEGDQIEVFAKTEGGSGNLTFYAYSEDGGTNLTLIFARFDVSLVIVDNEKSAEPGMMAQYTLEITNLGNREDTIRLEIESEMGRDWGTLSTNKVVLKAGAKTKEYLSVTIPEGTQADVMENITVRAITNYGDGPDDVKTSYTSVSQVYLLDVDLIGTVEQSGLPEETLEYMVRITNLGNGEDFVILGVNETVDWDIDFSENAFLLEDTGDYKDISVYITVPENEPYLNRIEVHIQARSAGAVYFYSDGTLNASAAQLLDGALERIEPDAEALPGKEAWYNITVTNTGNTDGVVFNIRAQRDIDRSSVSGTVKFGPSSLTSVTLDSGDDETITLQIRPNANALAGGVLVATVEITSPALAHPQKITITTTVKLNEEDPILTRDDSQHKSILPGGSETFNFTLENRINSVDTISFDIENSNPTDFEVYLNGVTVPGSDDRSVTLTVRALMSTHQGSETYINVTALSSLSGDLKSEKIPVDVSVDVPIYGFSVGAPNPVVVVTLGDTNTYTFDISRTGNDKELDTYSAVYLVALNPGATDWDFSYLDTVIFPASSVSKTKSVPITISIPESTAHLFSTKDVAVTVKSLENPELVSRFTLTVLLNKKPVIKPPTVKYGDTRINLSKHTVNYNTEYTFEANLGSDEDNISEEVKQYSWDWGDLTEPGDRDIVTHSYERPDAYTITLRVLEWSDEDHTELYSESSYQFSFDAENPGPVFDAEIFYVDSEGYRVKYQETEGIAKGVMVEFNASESEGIELTAVSYTWNFGDGTIKTTKTNITDHTYTRSGVYTMNVRGEDKFGKTFSKERTITITNRKPVAAFKMTKGNEESITRLEIEEDDEVAFDALSSEDPDQSDIIVSYVWDFGDGTNGTGLTPSHIYKKKGTWNVTLTVYDQEGEKDVISATVVVEEKGEDVPFGIELIIWVVIAMVLLMAAFMIIPGAMARISGASKVDIAKILEKKIDEKVEAMDEDKILEYKFGGKGAPEELQKEQIVPEPTPQVQVPVTPVVAPAPIFAASRFCTSCGATVEQGAKFCTECGTPY